MNEYMMKQVIVVRKDIKMSKGKLIVQAAHAAVDAFYKTYILKPEWAKRWIKEGQPKIVCKVNQLSDLKKLLDKAQELGVPSTLIMDAGLTELPAGTFTCIGLGPAPVKIIDKITGSLPLL